MELVNKIKRISPHTCKCFAVFFFVQALMLNSLVGKEHKDELKSFCEGQSAD